MSQYAPIDWYDTPRYYDLIFDEDTAREADFIEAARERYGLRRGKRILEPACGSGRTMAELARRGYSVAGFDTSQPMLDYAAGRMGTAKPKPQLRQGQLESFRYVRPFQLAHCLVSTFKYVLDGSGARSHLECISQALSPGGIYLLGLHLTDYSVASLQRERWVVKRGRLQVTCNTQTWPANRRTRLEKVRTRLRVVERGIERRSETIWNFRTYNARQLRALIRQVPAFELLAVHDFHYDIDWTGELSDGASDVLVVLRKKR